MSLLATVNPPSPTSTSSSSSSFFSRFFAPSAKNSSGLVVSGNDGNSSRSGFYGEGVDLGGAHVENSGVEGTNSSGPVIAHGGNSSRSDFSGEGQDLGSSHVKSSGVDAKNSTGLVISHDGKSSRSDFSGEGLDLGSTHHENSTADAKNSAGLVISHEGNSSNSVLSGEEPVYGNPTGIANDSSGLVIAHEGNSSKVGYSGGDPGSESAHIKNLAVDAKNVSAQPGPNLSKDDHMGSYFEKKDGVASGSAEVTVNVSVKCNIYNGRWVRDEMKPYYPGGSCPHIDDDFNCHKNGRPDEEFLKWRWQPYDCDIPSLNATDFLARLRGKRLLFVGDSLNRNMWESLVCILRHSVKRKNKVYEVSGRHDFKTKGYYSFRFEDYGCSVDYVRSPFLVRELFHKNANGLEDEKLRLDLLDETTPAYRGADIIVFNTGHWWTHDKTSRGIEYYQEGNRVYPVLEVMEAYKKALATWARWVDKNIDKKKTQVVFRGYSLTHFSGGQWNSGGQCHKETEPIYNETFLAKYPAKMRALEPVLKQMKTPVIYLNISRLTDYRKDGHPSIYRKKYKTVEEQIAAEKSQDCSHWCLPGIPDTWNELLYASLLLEGKGSWMG